MYPSINLPAFTYTKYFEVRQMPVWEEDEEMLHTNSDKCVDQHCPAEITVPTTNLI